jgi:CheY-like chemotaxis protein
MSHGQPILLVEDDIGLLKLYELILAHAGFAVETATSGKQALEVLEGLQPRVIISDLMMPDMDGTELCQRIKANNQWTSIPFIVLTASNDQKRLQRILDCGAARIINKPIRPATLADIVQNAVTEGAGNNGSMREVANF